MSLQEILDGETIESLPLREPVAIQSGTVVRAAVAQMRDHEVGCAVLVDTKGTPTGIFTERSLLRVLVDGVSLDERPVAEFAYFEFATVKLSDRVTDLWNAVTREDVRFVCVTDDNGKLVGLTGQRGLAEFLSESFPRQVTVQRIGGTPWMQTREGA